MSKKKSLHATTKKKTQREEDAFTEALKLQNEKKKRKKLVTELQSAILEHQILDETEIKIKKALFVMNKKIQKRERKLRIYSIEKLKADKNERLSALKKMLTIYNSRKDGALSRIEKISTQYATIKMKLDI